MMPWWASVSVFDPTAKGQTQTRCCWGMVLMLRAHWRTFMQRRTRAGGSAWTGQPAPGAQPAPSVRRASGEANPFAPKRAVRPPERRKRTTGGQVKALLQSALIGQYGADWADEVARHLDNGGDFYVSLLFT